MEKDESLAEYREKRDFRRTPEPPGGEERVGQRPIFVVQKHDASQLHYDFRLEVDGVLKSWAVPKGPSVNPHNKRLAVPTEDHPMEYAAFEGLIPADEYGGGTVQVWDVGTYQNISEKNGEILPAGQALEKGHLDFVLDGRKLCGAFTLTRMAKRKGWLLIKRDDEHASRVDELVDTRPESAISGRSLDEIRSGSG